MRLAGRRPAPADELAFVIDVTGTARDVPAPPRERTARDPRVERRMLVCWGLIALKSAAVFWLFDRYHVPVNPWWIVGPTLFFAALSTLLYLVRDSA